MTIECHNNNNNQYKRQFYINNKKYAEKQQNHPLRFSFVIASTFYFISNDTHLIFMILYNSVFISALLTSPISVV